MNHTGAKVREILSALIGYVADKSMPEVIVAPVFPYLGEAVSLAKETGYELRRRTCTGKTAEPIREKFRRSCSLMWAFPMLF